LSLKQDKSHESETVLPLVGALYAARRNDERPGLSTDRMQGQVRP